ncbi:hypothetical protein BGZ63DRAFT_382907 [Mariannaea sp. PMI_226]|nr:hypothetical protein BGZ63DRAFT_382907 [Mariannaea sp. PMI_226]
MAALKQVELMKSATNRRRQSFVHMVPSFLSKMPYCRQGRRTQPNQGKRAPSLSAQLIGRVDNRSSRDSLGNSGGGVHSRRNGSRGDGGRERVSSVADTGRAVLLGAVAIGSPVRDRGGGASLHLVVMMASAVTSKGDTAALDRLGGAESDDIGSNDFSHPSSRGISGNGDLREVGRAVAENGGRVIRSADEIKCTSISAFGRARSTSSRARGGGGNSSSGRGRLDVCESLRDGNGHDEKLLQHDGRWGTHKGWTEY